MIATFDGACEPYNPGGAMGLGWTIDGVPSHKFIESEPANTNNVAEYLALERVLDAALAMASPDTLEIWGDSKLVVEQLAGNWAVASPSIRPIYEVCRTKMEQLHKAGWRVTLFWHPRENNEVADAASKAALVEHGIEPARRKPKSGYVNLTAVGRRVGISAVAAGRRLVVAGWRGTDGEPTEIAIATGIADRRFDGWWWKTDWRLDALVAQTAEAKLVTASDCRQGRPSLQLMPTV